MHTKSIKNEKGLVIAVLLSAGLITISSASADIFEPEGIRSGSTIYYPFASLSYGHDDNVLSQETNPQASNVTTLAAGVSIQVAPDNSRGVFQFAADVQSGKYESSPGDDYDDYGVLAGYIYQPNDKMNLSITAEVKQLHDPRSPLTLATRPSLDVYSDTVFEGEWYYGFNDWEGADTSIIISMTERSYESDLSVNIDKNRSTNEISGLLRFPIAPNTRIRISGRLIDFDYDVNNTKDSSQTRLMVGVGWQVSDITLLSAEVGQQEKDFDQNVIADDTDVAWEIGLTWAPEEYSIVEITTSNDFDESITDALFIRKRTIEIEWKYDWEDYLRFTLIAGNIEETSEFGATDTVDDINYASLSLQYALRPTMQVTGGISSTSISSDTAGNSSDKLVVNVGIKAVF